MLVGRKNVPVPFSSPRPVFIAVPFSSPIYDAGLVPRLAATVPALTSSDFAYFDPAMIVCRVRAAGGELVIDDVRDVFLYRDGKEFRIDAERGAGG